MEEIAQSEQGAAESPAESPTTESGGYRSRGDFSRDLDAAVDELFAAESGGVESTESSTEEVPTASTAPTPEPQTAAPDSSAPAPQPEWMQAFQGLLDANKALMEEIRNLRQPAADPQAPEPATPVDPMVAAARQVLGDAAPDHLVKAYVDQLQKTIAHRAFKGQRGWDTPEAEAAIDAQEARLRQIEERARGESGIHAELAKLRQELADLKSAPQRADESKRRATARTEALSAMLGSNEITAKSYPNLARAAKERGMGAKIAAYLVRQAGDHSDENSFYDAADQAASLLEPMVGELFGGTAIESAPTAEPEKESAPVLGAKDNAVNTRPDEGRKYVSRRDFDRRLSRELSDLFA